MSKACDELDKFTGYLGRVQLPKNIAEDAKRRASESPSKRRKVKENYEVEENTAKKSRRKALRNTDMHTCTQYAYWGLHQTKFKCRDEKSSLTNLDNLNGREEFCCQYFAVVNCNGTVPRF